MTTISEGEYYERWIRFDPNDFEIVDFVFEGGVLDRVVYTSDLNYTLLDALEREGNYAAMQKLIDQMGFEFVELVNYTEQTHRIQRAYNIWRSTKRT